jgi:hypothetical protein
MECVELKCSLSFGINSPFAGRQAATRAARRSRKALVQEGSLVSRGYRRPSTNACQAPVPTVTTGPEGFLLSRTGTVPVGRVGATSTQSPPVFPL